MRASSRQNPLATLSCTFRVKFTHIQLLTLPPFTIFLFIIFH
uniref:AGO915 n=1 Tax=Arundo donax TaxID=35708 RepID=A0A0A9FDD4_ARUDO